jgi:hypothetical protein
MTSNNNTDHHKKSSVRKLSIEINPFFTSSQNFQKKEQALMIDKSSDDDNLVQLIKLSEENVTP